MLIVADGCGCGRDSKNRIVMKEAMKVVVAAVEEVSNSGGIVVVVIIVMVAVAV